MKEKTELETRFWVANRMLQLILLLYLTEITHDVTFTKRF